jgi:hypothetical protein
MICIFTKILASLRKFGLSGDNKMSSLIVAVFDGDPQLLEKIQTLIHGTLTSFSSLIQIAANTTQIIQVSKCILYSNYDTM